MAAAGDAEGSVAVAYVYRDSTRSIYNGLQAHFNDPRLSDIVLVRPDGRAIHVHQVILSSCSQKFASVLSRGDATGKELPVQGVDSTALESVVAFFYRGEVLLSPASVVPILDVALKLEVPGLAAGCEQYIGSHMAPATCAIFLQGAVQLCLESTIQLCLNYAKSRFDDVVSSAAFQALSTEAVRLLLTTTRAHAGDLAMARALARWAVRRPQQLAECEALLAELQITTSALLQLLQTPDLVQTLAPAGGGGGGGGRDGGGGGGGGRESTTTMVVGMHVVDRDTSIAGGRAGGVCCGGGLDGGVSLNGGGASVVSQGDWMAVPLQHTSLPNVTRWTDGSLPQQQPPQSQLLHPPRLSPASSGGDCDDGVGGRSGGGEPQSSGGRPSPWVLSERWMQQPGSDEGRVTGGGGSGAGGGGTRNAVLLPTFLSRTANRPLADITSPPVGRLERSAAAAVAAVQPQKAGDGSGRLGTAAAAGVGGGLGQQPADHSAAEHPGGGGNTSGGRLRRAPGGRHPPQVLSLADEAALPGPLGNGLSTTIGGGVRVVPSSGPTADTEDPSNAGPLGPAGGGGGEGGGGAAAANSLFAVPLQALETAGLTLSVLPSGTLAASGGVLGLQQMCLQVVSSGSSGLLALLPIALLRQLSGEEAVAAAGVEVEERVLPPALTLPGSGGFARGSGMAAWRGGLQGPDSGGLDYRGAPGLGEGGLVLEAEGDSGMRGGEVHPGGGAVGGPLGLVVKREGPEGQPIMEFQLMGLLPGMAGGLGSAAGTLGLPSGGPPPPPRYVASGGKGGGMGGTAPAVMLDLAAYSGEAAFAGQCGSGSGGGVGAMLSRWHPVLLPPPTAPPHAQAAQLLGLLERSPESAGRSSSAQGPQAGSTGGAVGAAAAALGAVAASRGAGSLQGLYLDSLTGAMVNAAAAAGVAAGGGSGGAAGGGGGGGASGGKRRRVSPEEEDPDHYEESSGRWGSGRGGGTRHSHPVRSGFAAGVEGAVSSPPGFKPALVCHVDNCNADLSAFKEYHQRFRICEYHLKAEVVMRDGLPQRFCQQCGRFHSLSEFDGIKRSCRTRLQRHNARRRKRPDQRGGGGSNSGGRGEGDGMSDEHRGGGRVSHTTVSTAAAAAAISPSHPLAGPQPLSPTLLTHPSATAPSHTLPPLPLLHSHEAAALLLREAAAAVAAADGLGGPGAGAGGNPPPGSRSLGGASALSGGPNIPLPLLSLWMQHQDQQRDAERMQRQGSGAGGGSGGGSGAGQAVPHGNPLALVWQEGGETKQSQPPQQQGLQHLQPPAPILAYEQQQSQSQSDSEGQPPRPSELPVQPDADTFPPVAASAGTGTDADAATHAVACGVAGVPAAGVGGGGGDAAAAVGRDTEMRNGGDSGGSNGGGDADSSGETRHEHQHQHTGPAPSTTAPSDVSTGGSVRSGEQVEPQGGVQQPHLEEQQQLQQQQQVLLLPAVALPGVVEAGQVALPTVSGGPVIPIATGGSGGGGGDSGVGGC